MGIKGLTDRDVAFPQIGDVRKGRKKTSAKGNEYPVDLDYFKVDFDEREKATAEAFVKKYGATPREINIVLPFNEIERCWDAWCEGYTAGRMVARSDGEYFLYKVSLSSGEVEVINGASVATGEKVPHVENLGMAGKTMVKCKPVGRLKVIIPELQRLAYLVVHTTSVIDIRNLSEQLNAIAKVNNGRIVGIPLILKRRPKEISVPKDGQRVRLTKWMLSIEADPEWVAAKLQALNIAALPSGAGKIALPAVSEVEDIDEPDDITDDIEDEPIDSEWEEKEQPEPEPHPAPAPQPEPESEQNQEQEPSKSVRPYAPEIVKQGIEHKTKGHLGKIVSDKQRSLAAMLMGKLYEDDTRRHAAQKYLTGTASIKDMRPSSILALLDWLKPFQDSGGDYIPDPMASKEAQAIYDAAIISQGQQPLF